MARIEAYSVGRAIVVEDDEKWQDFHRGLLEPILGKGNVDVVGKLEYTYIVGIEDLDMFKKGAEALVPHEELYGGRIIGNNFANIWLLPLDEFNLSSYLDCQHS